MFRKIMPNGIPDGLENVTTSHKKQHLKHIPQNMLKIRRPLEEGPPGCEEFARACIFDLRLQWNHITALTFSYFHILDALKGQSLISHVSCLISHVSCLISHVSWTVYCPPETDQSPSTQRRLRIWDDPKITMKIHQFSSRSPRQQKP